MKQVNNAISNVAKSLANTNPVKDSVSLSDDSKKLWVDYAKVYKDGEATKGLLVDSLISGSA